MTAISKIRQITIIPSSDPDNICLDVAAKQVIDDVCSPERSPHDFFVFKSNILTTSSVPPIASKLPLVVEQVNAWSDAENANSYFKSVLSEIKSSGALAEKPKTPPS